MERSKSDREGEVSYDISHMWNVNGKENVCKPLDLSPEGLLLGAKTFPGSASLALSVPRQRARSEGLVGGLSSEPLPQLLSASLQMAFPAYPAPTTAVMDARPARRVSRSLCQLPSPALCPDSAPQGPPRLLGFSWSPACSRKLCVTLFSAGDHGVSAAPSPAPGLPGAALT